LHRIHDAGFVFVDTQVNFRIRLARTPDLCAEPVTVVPASTRDWQVDSSQWAIFGHERFRILPEVNAAKLNCRYEQWAADLISKFPDHCFELRSQAGPEGWYFASPGRGGSVNLALGVRSQDARVSGHTLYQAALRHLGEMGYRLGWASFSIANTAVHNIYAQLGAHFTAPTGIWLWTRNA
jgi:hypothetical protein